MPLAGALIGAGTSIIGGFIGSGAAKKAAAQQRESDMAAKAGVDYATGAAVDRGYAGIAQANDAIDTGTAAANKYIADTGTAQKNLYGDMTANLQPYRDVGEAGTSAVTYGLDKLKSTAGTFSFNPSDLENDPGYQFQLQQGMKALNNNAAARGMLQSGANLKAAIGYEQGLAGTAYQNAYNRALSTFNTNQSGYQNLANLGLNTAGVGLNANSQGIQAAGLYGGQLTSLANLRTNTAMQGAGLKSNVAMQGNEYIGNTQMQGAKMGGDYLVGAGNAQAAGTVGAANAWTGALGGVGNAAMTYGLSRMGTQPYGASDGGYVPTGGVPAGMMPAPWSPGQ